MIPIIEKLKKAVLIKNCPHCNKEISFFFSKELMQNSKMKTCLECNEKFKVKVNYKIMAYTAIPIILGLSFITTLMFNNSQIAIMFTSAIAGIIGFANASKLIK